MLERLLGRDTCLAPRGCGTIDWLVGKYLCARVTLVTMAGHGSAIYNSRTLPMLNPLLATFHRLLAQCNNGRAMLVGSEFNGFKTALLCRRYILVTR